MVNEMADLGEGGVEFGEDLLVGEANDVQIECFQLLGAFLVVGELVALVVVVSIEFDDEFGGGAVKVNDEACNGFLSVKLYAVDLFAAEFFPEDFFGCGLISAQGAGGLA